MITPVFFISDILVYLLIAILIFALVFGLNNINVRNRWKKVYRKKSSIVAMVVLVAFCLIGLLDSIHFTEQNSSSRKVVSLLDTMLKPLWQNSESSYSAPFASHLFIKTMVKEGKDNIKWVAEPLQYVKDLSIATLIWSALFNAMLIILGIMLAIWLYDKRYKKNLNWGSDNFITALISTSILIITAAICYKLSQYYHILGTDKIGTDVFYSSLKSIRTGLIIGTLTTILTLPFAIIFGALAGYYGGLIDDIIQYLYTTLSSIPGVLLIAAAMLSFESVFMSNTEFFSSTEQIADAKLILLCMILGITSWTTLCRILRAETLKLREQAFISAATTNGLNGVQIIVKHIVPNLMHIILIAIILDFSGLVLAEAVLSYVGVGVDATMFSWGNMINGARMEMGRDPIIWWSLTGAFILMFTLVLAANVFADGVRDVFDPRVK